MAPRIGVVVFPGTNCEHDVVQAAEAAGGTGVLLWHGGTRLESVDAVLLPGGFAHGDYLRPGALARFSSDHGGGARLRPLRRPGGRHLQRLPSPDRGGPAPGRAAEERAAALLVPTGPARGRLDGVGAHGGDPGGRRARHPHQPLLGQLHLRRRDAAPPAGGGSHRAALRRQPERLGGRIAGIANGAGNVVGLMPHPERASSALLGSEDGLVLLRSLVAAASARAAA